MIQGRGAVTIFDLFFLVLVVVSLGACFTALIAAVRGQARRALPILRNFAMAALSYVIIVAMVGFLAPQRVLRVGEPWCFDDWCLTVESVHRTPPVSYEVSLRLSSRALRVSQRAKGAWVCLIDDQGNRYAPDPADSEVPLDLRLAPGESVVTTRTFRVPADTAALGLITGHGPAWLPSLIIADEASLFHKPTFVRLE